MDVLNRSGLEKLAGALSDASPHHMHFIITGIDHKCGEEIIGFLRENNFHTPRTNTAGDYKFLAIPTPKGEERERLINALKEKGISTAIEANQGARR